MPTDLDERRLGRDLALPLTADDELEVTATGDILSVAGRANLRRAVRRRVLTAPGTLLHRPDYGAGLVEHLELSSSPARRSGMANAIRRNLLRDARLSEARARVSPALPGTPGRAAAVTVELSVELRHDQSRQDLSLDVTE